MVGGLNTNVGYRGRTFHVQTQGEGLGRPIIVSLLYEGGAILFSKRQSCAPLAPGVEGTTRLRQQMEEQHRLVVQALKAGKLDPRLGFDRAAADTGVAFGAGVISERTLDEVILAHLARHAS
jgi:hypothetical protein